MGSGANLNRFPLAKNKGTLTNHNGLNHIIYVQIRMFMTTLKISGKDFWRMLGDEPIILKTGKGKESFVLSFL